MKFEKINENQIRCTLDSVDLNDRQLNIRELTYGTEKARSLFREMIQRASYELDFDAEDIPLMIETIPLTGDSIMLLITKMEDPEELDTRFAKFSPADEEPDEDSGHSLLSRIQDRAADSVLRSSRDNQSGNLLRIFRFSSLDDVSEAAKVVSPLFSGGSALYHNAAAKEFFLCVRQACQLPETYNKVCNLLGEYGSRINGTASSEAYYKEHYAAVISRNALSVLASL